MKPNPNKFAQFKYEHVGPASIEGKHRIVLYLTLGLAVGVTLIAPPQGSLSFLLPLLVFLFRQKKLRLGPRYLLCGADIVYYANVTHLTLIPAKGQLSLQSSNGKTLLITQDKFHTNARKKDKIAHNQAAKFDKVARKIIEHVRSASSSAQISGVPG